MSDHEYGISVIDWIRTVRRARLGRTVKAVALMAATYADSDGTRIFPGVALLSVDCEISYNVIKTSLATLRDAGLIERVSYGARRDGKSDEYRLILHPEVQDRIDLWTPTQVKIAAQKVQTLRGGRHRAPDRDGDLQPTLWAANDPALQPTGCAPKEGLQPTARAAKADAREAFAAHGVGPSSGFAAHGVGVLQPTPLPPTEPLHRHLTPTVPTDVDLHTDVTAPQVAIIEEPKIDSLPEKCTHGFRARRRADGSSSCALCRIAARMTPAPREATA